MASSTKDADMQNSVEKVIREIYGPCPIGRTYRMYPSEVML